MLQASRRFGSAYSKYAGLGQHRQTQTGYQQAPRLEFRGKNLTGVSQYAAGNIDMSAPIMAQARNQMQRRRQAGSAQTGGSTASRGGGGGVGMWGVKNLGQKPQMTNYNRSRFQTGSDAFWYGKNASIYGYNPAAAMSAPRTGVRRLFSSASGPGVSQSYSRGTMTTTYGRA
jgi:hypothetical protein